MSQNVAPFPDNDDILGVVGEAQTALIADYAEVHAVCSKVTEHAYKWGPRLLFTFTVIDPPKYEGIKLFMFARIVTAWKEKYFPESSKLYKMACIAAGKRLPRGFRITKSLWVGKAFKCRLETSGKGAARYTTVSELLERLTG
jgi:hypothetical protein